MRVCAYDIDWGYSLEPPSIKGKNRLTAQLT